MNRKPSTGKITVSRDRILRAVASSSAIKTHERVEVIEKRLKLRARRLKRDNKLTLAS